MNTEVQPESSETAALELLRCDIRQNFLTKLELARILKRNPRTLDRWDVLRIGPPIIRIGRAVYYKRSSVLAWIEANESRPLRRKAGVR
jgi:hypothetical protein